MPDQLSRRSYTIRILLFTTFIVSGLAHLCQAGWDYDVFLDQRVNVNLKSTRDSSIAKIDVRERSVGEYIFEGSYKPEVPRKVIHFSVKDLSGRILGGCIARPDPSGRFRCLMEISRNDIRNAFFVDFVEEKIESLPSRVTSVKDGDTIEAITVDGHSITCRLYGIDAPESDQPFGSEAAERLIELVRGQEVMISRMGDVTYDREVCVLMTEGMIVNLEMVKSGYAWAYRNYLHDADGCLFIDAEEHARARNLGLWRQTRPEPPWEYRRNHR